MKRYLVLILALLYGGTMKAQDAGIKFVKALSWSQIKEKAKLENKYIFLDGYTTWCLPCKVMTKEIFPQPVVGNFFNANFINVAVQFDVAKKDSEETKKWYKDARMLSDKYKINSYPTYLFFNPEGELVHTVIGGSEKAEDFVNKSKLALDPATQYNMLKKQFEAGNRSEAFLSNLFKAAGVARDEEFVASAGNAYLLKQKDLLSKENLAIIQVATKKTTDPGFAILRDHPAKLDSVAGPGTSIGKIRTILFHEFVFPHLRKNAKIKEYGGGMIMYSGDVNKQVDWQAIKAKLDTNFPPYAEQVLLSGKISYFEWTKAWPEYTRAVEAYIPTLEGDPYATMIIDSYANVMLRECGDRDCLSSALNWSKSTLSADNMNLRMHFSSTYSKLLYKSGEKEQAILFMENAIKNGKDPYGSYAGLLSKMKNGEQIQ